MTMPEKWAALVVFAMLYGIVFGYAIGISEALPPTPPTKAAVDSLRFDMDVLHGKTLAGIEMCRAAYDANPWTP